MPRRRAPASMAFSTNSLTTEAGRSTTSPAAIWLARSVGRRVMRPMCQLTEWTELTVITRRHGNTELNGKDNAVRRVGPQSGPTAGRAERVHERDPNSQKKTEQNSQNRS